MGRDDQASWGRSDILRMKMLCDPAVDDSTCLMVEAMLRTAAETDMPLSTAFRAVGRIAAKGRARVEYELAREGPRLWVLPERRKVPRPSV